MRHLFSKKDLDRRIERVNIHMEAHMETMITVICLSLFCIVVGWAGGGEG